MDVREEVTVKASPGKVWEMISDPRNAPQFNNMVQEVRAIQGNGGVGTRWTAVAQLMGRTEIANEITEWEPTRRLAIKMEGPASGTLTFSLSPEDGGVLVEATATSNLPALTAPLVQPMLQSNIRESLQRIKHLVEQG